MISHRDAHARFKPVHVPKCNCAVEFALMKLIQSNGAEKFRLICRQCGRSGADLANGNLLPQEKDEAPIWKQNDPRDLIPCAICGETPTEYHHLAPRALFEDAEFWPGIYVCIPCHKRWHAVLKTPNAPQRYQGASSHLTPNPWRKDDG